MQLIQCNTCLWKARDLLYKGVNNIFFFQMNSGS